ncbi:MAG: vanadium-dependent haloperoxidase [Candidatus Kapaibacterium sp.]
MAMHNFSYTPLLRMLALCAAVALLMAPRASAQKHIQDMDDKVDSIYMQSGARYIHEWNRLITDVMIDDGWSPPIATRYYAYANVAAFQAAMPGFPMCRSLEGQLAGLKDVPKPDLKQTYDWRVSAIAAYQKITKKLLARSYRSDSLYALHMQQIAATGVPADVIDRSKLFGESVGDHIIKWLMTDGYVNITARSRYVIPKGTGMWEPTEPDFKEPADPFWNTMRPMTLTTAGQFPPDPPAKFSANPKSEFHRNANEVFQTGKNLTDEQRTIALYWNDNPITTRHYGHLMYTVRWMTPPGHWINITREVSEKKGLGMIESLEAYTLVSIAVYDGFISCWTEKYHSNVIRPISYIHRYMDSTWEPLIQTPPFPEHSSGHSTISAAAATILTHLLGEFSFTDSTTLLIGFQPRTFKNFMEAAREAGMSRLYGGIHYRTGNQAGTKNGVQVGEWVFQKVHTRI